MERDPETTHGEELHISLKHSRVSSQFYEPARGHFLSPLASPLERILSVSVDSLSVLWSTHGCLPVMTRPISSGSPLIPPGTLLRGGEQLGLMLGLGRPADPIKDVGPSAFRPVGVSPRGQESRLMPGMGACAGADDMGQLWRRA